jgi:hypothetical protein
MKTNFHRIWELEVSIPSRLQFLPSFRAHTDNMMLGVVIYTSSLGK